MDLEYIAPEDPERERVALHCTVPNRPDAIAAARAFFAKPLTPMLQASGRGVRGETTSGVQLEDNDVVAAARVQLGEGSDPTHRDGVTSDHAATRGDDPPPDEEEEPEEPPPTDGGGGGGGLPPGTGPYWDPYFNYDEDEQV